MPTLPPEWIDHLAAGCICRLGSCSRDGVPRLILLQRRLARWGGPLQIEKSGRGRFRRVVGRRLVLDPGAGTGAGH